VSIYECKFDYHDYIEDDNPFLPPFMDNHLVMDNLFTTNYRLKLNKFPRTKHHVLILTKEFEK